MVRVLVRILVRVLVRVFRILVGTGKGGVGGIEIVLVLLHQKVLTDYFLLNPLMNCDRPDRVEFFLIVMVLEIVGVSES